MHCATLAFVNDQRIVRATVSMSEIRVTHVSTRAYLFTPVYHSSPRNNCKCVIRPLQSINDVRHEKRDEKHVNDDVNSIKHVLHY